MKYIEIHGETATIRVSGRFDLIHTAEVMAEVKEVFNTYGCTKICVDFRETTYIDSAAIRDLGRLYRVVKPENFLAKNAKGDVLAALTIAKLDTLWRLNASNESGM